MRNFGAGDGHSGRMLVWQTENPGLDPRHSKTKQQETIIIINQTKPKQSPVICSKYGFVLSTHVPGDYLRPSCTLDFAFLLCKGPAARTVIQSLDAGCQD